MMSFNIVGMIHYVTVRVFNSFILKTGPRKAELHLENAETHIKIVQMNLQWIQNDEINLKKSYISELVPDCRVHFAESHIADLCYK
jgi:hypothetical protein